MHSVTAKELKNRTGAVLRRVRAGATVAVTNRGRRIAVISPAATPPPAEKQPQSQQPSELWAEIEAVLATTTPEHLDWREAMRHTRGRP
jgi:prevent-host-death family protein